MLTIRPIKNEQQLKLESVRKSLDIIYMEASKYIQKDDTQILALKDFQLILGVTQVLWEDQILGEINAAVAPFGEKATLDQGPIMMPAGVPEVPKGMLQAAEEEFHMPEFMEKKKGVLH